MHVLRWKAQAAAERTNAGTEINDAVSVVRIAAHKIAEEFIVVPGFCHDFEVFTTVRQRLDFHVPTEFVHD